MASTFTPNVQLEEPARSDDVGTWDTPVNNNMTLLDLIAGGLTTISMAAGSVVLSAAQFKCKTITLNSTLAGNATITFPTSFVKSYEVQNSCFGSSFTITLQTTAAGGQVICCPPGEIVDVLNDGVNLKYRNLGRVGSFLDLYTATVPTWISGCTVPPYLNCNGTTFSSATYPALTSFLGSTTLPDSRGRVRAAMQAGTGLLSLVIADTLGNLGGDQHLHTHTHVDAGHTHVTANPGGGLIDGYNAVTPVSQTTADVFVPYQSAGIDLRTLNTGTGTANIGFSGLGLSQNVQPTYLGGLTLIRSA